MTTPMTDLIGTAPPSQFLSKMKAAATIVGLSPSSWASNGIASAIMTVIANALGVPTGTANLLLAQSGLDGLAAVAAMSGFLDLAALVTPNPPTQQDDGTFNGWLDILADSRFDLRRTAATKATGPVVLTNTSTAARGPFAPYTYHLGSTALKMTYSNTETLTIGASGDTTATFAADSAGAAYNVVANTLVPVTSLVGVSVKTSGGANLNTLIGINAQSNKSLVAACRAKLQALSPKLGPDGAYIYFATNGYGGAALSAPVTRVFDSNDPFTGNVIVYIANDFGTASGGDATAMQAWLRAVVQPDGAQVFALAAATVAIAVTADVYVPSSKNAVAAAEVSTAITNYINSIPIGGSPGPTSGVQISDVLAVIFENVPYVYNVENLHLNGTGTDVPLPAGSVAVVSPSPVITVHGI